MCHSTTTLYPIKPATKLAAPTRSTTGFKTKPRTASQKAVATECIICLDKVNYNASLHTANCDHTSCRNCLCNYVNSLLKKSTCLAFDTIPCPQTGCENVFQTSDILKSIFDIKEIKAWWESANTKIFMKNKVTCPFRNCGVAYDVDEDFLKECTFTACLVCHKGFCTACQTPWHPGVMKVVNEKEHLKKTLEVAKHKAWTRCPHCKRFVEKIDGCTSMTCTCGTSFCYRCGGLQRSHICSNHCEKFSLAKLEEIRKNMFSLTDLSHYNG